MSVGNIYLSVSGVGPGRTGFFEHISDVISVDTGNLRIGIGTGSPASILEVFNVSNAGGEISRFSSNYSQGGYIRFQDINSGATRGYIGYGQTLFTTVDSSIFGLRSEGAMTFATNGGTRRVTIGTNGNVGINVTTPNVYLHAAIGGQIAIATAAYANGLQLIGNSGDVCVVGTLGAEPLVFRTNSSEKMRIFSDGNVGIGSSSIPSSEILRVQGNVNANEIVMTNVSVGTRLIVSGAAAYDKYFMIKEGNIGAIVLSTSVATDRVTIAGNFQDVQLGNNNSTGYTTLYAGAAEKARITSAGFVGIGTTVPDSLLHVYGNSAGSVTAVAGTIATFENDGSIYLSLLTPNASERGILFGEASSNTAGGIIYNGGNTVSGLQFRTNGNTTKMVITKDGNVGIGTTIPATKLHLSGTSSQIIIDESSLPYVLFRRNTSAKLYVGVGDGSSLLSRAAAGDGVIRAEQKLLIAGGGDTNGITLTDLFGFRTTNPEAPIQFFTGTLINFKLYPTDSAFDLNYNGDSRVFLSANAQGSWGSNYVNQNGDAGIRLGQTGRYSYIVGGSSLLLNPVAGNVGIGTGTPSFILDVISNTNDDQGIRTRNLSAGSSAGSYLYLGNDVADTRGQIFLNSSANTSFGGAQSLNILTDANVPISLITNSIERMRVLGNGKVGIGISNPTEALSVSGNLLLSGAGLNPATIKNNYTYDNGEIQFFPANVVNPIIFSPNGGVTIGRIDTNPPGDGLIVRGSGGFGFFSPTANLHVSGTATNRVTSKIQRRDAQTADMTQWLDWNGNILLAVDSGGVITGLGSFVTPAQTGNFVTNGMTGQFVDSSDTGQFVTTSDNKNLHFQSGLNVLKDTRFSGGNNYFTQKLGVGTTNPGYTLEVSGGNGLAINYGVSYGFGNYTHFNYLNIGENYIRGTFTHMDTPTYFLGGSVGISNANIVDLLNVSGYIKCSGLSISGSRQVLASETGNFVTNGMTGGLGGGGSGSSAPSHYQLRFIQTGSAVISNTTAERSLISGGLGTRVISGNTFVPGQYYRITQNGYFHTNATGAVFTYRPKLNSTDLAGNNTVTVSDKINGPYSLCLNLFCKSIGTNGVIYSNGYLNMGCSGISASVYHGLAYSILLQGSDVTINTTIDQTIDFTMQFNAAAVLTEIGVYHGLIEKIAF